MMLFCPVLVPTTPSNYNEFALFSVGWRDRPQLSCEFGNIVAPIWNFTDYEGALLNDFPQRLGPDGVQHLTIQFQSYSNRYWQDMNLMIDLQNVTQPGTLELYIPDATIPLTTAQINPGDTVCYFNPGGIIVPGTHQMMLTASNGLSMGVDALVYTTALPIPVLPTVVTSPLAVINATNATGGGNVTSDGGDFVSARGVCWSLSPNPTILDNITSDGTGTGTYSSFLAGLNPSTTYHVRAYATNIMGTAYGQDIPFTTLALVPPVQIVQNVTVPSGQVVCYNATQTIYVAGGGTYFTVLPGGDATFLAGHNIIYQPTVKVYLGGHMLGRIVTNNQYCPGWSPYSIVSVVEGVEPVQEIQLQSDFVLYPNPTTGNFVLEQKGDKLFGNVRIEVYGMRGDKVLAHQLTGSKKHEFSLSNVPTGLYFVRIVADDHVETIKLVITR